MRGRDTLGDTHSYGEGEQVAALYTTPRLILSVLCNPLFDWLRHDVFIQKVLSPVNSLSQFSAAPSMAGYLFQCRYALYRSLQIVEKSTNSHVSIERYDDIAFESDDFADCLIQAKHNITPKSLSNNSVDLWKTIRVWLHERANGSVITDSTRFHLITNSEAEEASALSYLRPDPSPRDEEEAYNQLRIAAKSSTNVTTKEGRAAFLALTKEESIEFLTKVELFDRTAGLVDVREEIVGKLRLISDAHAEKIADALEGWWLNTLGDHLVSSDLPPIALQLVLQKANDVGDQYKGDGLRIDEPEELDAKTYSSSDEALTFVQQMRSVDLPERAVRRGVHDFYRASAQRAKWAREALLLDGESARFDDALYDRWERKADALLASIPLDTDADKKQYGQTMCGWASRDAYPFRNVVAAWITSGSYHALADKVRIGWHPDFEIILAKADALEDA